MHTTKLLAGLIAFTISLFAADPFVGSWKMNIAKSKLPPTMAGVKEDILTVEATGEGHRVTEEFTRNDGRKRRSVNTIVTDGKEHPATLRGNGKEVPNSVMIFERRDDRHITASFKTDGKVVQTMEQVVSQDGKTLTSERHGKTPTGQPIDELDVYERE